MIIVKTEQGSIDCLPVRVTLSRKKGWRMPANTVKVCRPSKWGNPYKIGDDVPGLTGEKMDRQDVVHLHYISVISWPAEKVAECRAELAGKNLACWCKQDEECHADVLLDLANDKLRDAAQ